MDPQPESDAEHLPRQGAVLLKVLPLCGYPCSLYRWSQHGLVKVCLDSAELPSSSVILGCFESPCDELLLTETAQRDSEVCLEGNQPRSEMLFSVLVSPTAATLKTHFLSSFRLRPLFGFGPSWQTQKARGLLVWPIHLTCLKMARFLPPGRDFLFPVKHKVPNWLHGVRESGVVAQAPGALRQPGGSRAEAGGRGPRYAARGCGQNQDPILGWVHWVHGVKTNATNGTNPHPF